MLSSPNLYKFPGLRGWTLISLFARRRECYSPNVDQSVYIIVIDFVTGLAAQQTAQNPRLLKKAVRNQLFLTAFFYPG
jgi:hypothetical protein